MLVRYEVVILFAFSLKNVVNTLLHNINLVAEIIEFSRIYLYIKLNMKHSKMRIDWSQDPIHSQTQQKVAKLQKDEELITLYVYSKPIKNATTYFYMKIIKVSTGCSDIYKIPSWTQ